MQLNEIYLENEKMKIILEQWHISFIRPPRRREKKDLKCWMLEADNNKASVVSYVNYWTTGKNLIISSETHSVLFVS